MLIISGFFPLFLWLVAVTVLKRVQAAGLYLLNFFLYPFSLIIVIGFYNKSQLLVNLVVIGMIVFVLINLVYVVGSPKISIFLKKQEYENNLFKIGKESIIDYILIGAGVIPLVVNYILFQL